jgi:TonB family protein
MRNSPLRPDDLLDLFEIDSTAKAASETARREPALTAPPFPAGFGDPGPPGSKRADPSELDTSRATAEPDRVPPAPRQRALPLGLIGSLGLHLSPLLVLLHWGNAPAEIAAPIPVQLVVEEPPPSPLPVPAAKPPPPGRRASEDIGETKAEPDRTGETQIAAALPRPTPSPPPEPLPVLPSPAPAPEPAALPQEPKPPTHAEPPVKEAVAARLAPNPRPAPRAQVPGPAATRDEYLAYCMNLIRRHFGLLPPSFIAGRHGATVLSIVVLDDGTIARIAVARGSSYPDIDARIEEAVAAVRRFPPLPQWIQGPSVSLTLQLGYPGGL